jgi:hypothetical protein
VTRPPTGQGPFQKGERLTAAKLNEWVLQKPSVSVFGEGHSEGGVVAVDGRESMFVRLTGKNTANTPIKYAWKRVSRLPNGTWQDLTHTGNTTNDYAVEINNANLTVNTTTVYQAERSVTTGEWLFQQTGGTSNGTFSANSSETAVMILGTYAEYANCPNVPASPPTAYVDFCNGTRGTELCVPAYAYAVYQRCGYIWNKIGDTRTYQVWANEMNGGTISAYRRLYVPRWGGNMTESGPDPDSDCMGLAVLGYSSQGALTCSCPSWASDESNCIKVTFRTLPRPCPSGSCNYTDCADVFTLFDAGDSEGPFWDREFTVEINGSICNAGGQFGGGSGAGNVGIEFVDRSRTECFWGPDVFDPCDPCDGFGSFLFRIELNTEERPNCSGVGHIYATLSQSAMKALICNCISPSLANIEVCEGCDGNIGLPALVVIDTESIEITCCQNEAFYGGNSTSAFTDAYGSGNSTSSFTDAIYGGDS